MGHYSRYLNYTGDRLSGFERLRVDTAQTGFFEGREFRSFVEFSLAAAASLTVRFTSPVGFILFGQSLVIDEGRLRLEVRAGATPSGTFGVALPVIGKNRLPERRAPFYEPQVTLATGGSASGGTVVEVVRLNAGTASGQAQTAGGVVSDERGLPAGTYYLTLTHLGTGACTGVYNLWWEERARHASWPITAP